MMDDTWNQAGVGDDGQVDQGGRRAKLERLVGNGCKPIINGQMEP